MTFRTAGGTWRAADGPRKPGKRSTTRLEPTPWWEEEIDPEVGLWGIPGTSSVSFRDLVKVGVPAAVLYFSGNPVDAKEAQDRSLWAYDAMRSKFGDEVPTDEQVQQRILASYIDDAREAQGQVIVRSDGSVDVRMADGTMVHKTAAGVWSANPPGYGAGNKTPPLAPGQNASGRPPPDGYATWAKFREGIVAQAEVDDPGDPPQGFPLWGEYYRVTATEPPESMYPFLTAEQAICDVLHVPMYNAPKTGFGRPAVHGGVVGQLMNAYRHPGPAGPAQVFFGDGECEDGDVCWVRGAKSSPVLVRI